MTKLLIKENMPRQLQENAINTSLVVGFFSTDAVFPITSNEKGMEVPENLSQLVQIFELAKTSWPKDYISATESAESLPSMDWRKKKGLENLFLKGELLKDEDKDQLVDRLDFKISIPEDSSLSIIKSACNLAFRFGMETTKIDSFILADSSWKGNLIKFQEDEKVSINIEKEQSRFIVNIKGKGKELEEFIYHICETFPYVLDNKTWVDLLQEISDSLIMKNLDGQLAYLNLYSKKYEELEAYFSPKVEGKLEVLEKEYPDVDFKNHKALKKIYEKNYNPDWEVEVFKSYLEKVIEETKSGDKIKIEACLSEEKSVRDKLSTEIQNKAKERDIELEGVNIISSYKQGYSWIDELIIPKIKKTSKKVDEIDIYFKPFLKEGETEWVDEDGATPSYHNLGEDNPEKWLDLPIRFLQELYPVDDLLAEELGISRSKVNFKLYEGKEDITYNFIAKSQGKEIINADYKVRYSERPYLDKFPEMGKVHPLTSYMKVYVNGELKLEKRIKSDLENIWDIYQAEVLEDLMSYILQSRKGKLSEKEQPFFAQLRLDLLLSEVDHRLKFREDQISSLNSFHEDMYFVATDYFKNYGVKEKIGMLDAPGLILPVIKNQEGAPEFKVSLYDQQSAFPCIKHKGEVLVKEGSRGDIEVFIKEIFVEDGEYILKLKTNAEESIVESYAELLNQGCLEINKLISNVDRIIIESNREEYEVILKENEPVMKDLSILDIDLMEDELIGYDAYLDIISKLKRVEGIEVFKIAESYLGRDIYAIEILPKYQGYLSRTKRLTNLPSKLINARHHANEVSSTNAAFMLIKELLTNEGYKDLAEKMSLVIVPMENVDGTEIHYELQKDNPYWKLHVARFNAIGKEFYHEHFNPHTIHTEAMGLTRLWEKYLPDIMVDNHGVPSHEWEQQFSGYTSPSYKGFWLPRSILYGYFWYVTNDEYKGNYLVNKKMEDVIADRIALDDEITEKNKEWIDRFEKYAHAWLPKLFPADYYKNMINYWIPFEYDKDHRYPSIRFPWITTVSYTSEVADETAQGEYLYLCARAHLLHDLASLDMVMKSKCVYERDFKIDEDSINLVNIRQRPILV